MRVALVNPSWTFYGSVYFGCREPHLPLEYGYARALLEREGHEVTIVDAHSRGLSLGRIAEEVGAFRPDVSVVTTAPGYLFWRCAPPELRVCQETVRALGRSGGRIVAVGPHGSSCPGSTLKKLGCDAVILGEFEDLLPGLLQGGKAAFEGFPSVFTGSGNGGSAGGVRHAANMQALPALRWTDEVIRGHVHQHHRFDAAPAGPGAEMEASRGCPYRCSFCAKDYFRGEYRARPIPVVLDELDGLIAQGVEYVYFIDEIFMPRRTLLEALSERRVQFGVQLRIDLWDCDMLELLGRSGCVSIEAGVESVSEEGRERLHKKSRLRLGELSERLFFARKHIPFVQANLIRMESDDPESVERWRALLLEHGVWANHPVPVFPYPGSPLYRERWGEPDDQAWERAHRDYLRSHEGFSDIQEREPLPLCELELGFPA